MTTEIKYFTKEEALKTVKTKGKELIFCSPELQNDEDVVMAAIKNDSSAFEYASAELKFNKIFIMKALNEGVYPWYLITDADTSIQSDLEAMTLAIGKSEDGFVFTYAEGEAALSKELAAKALVKWGNYKDSGNLGLWGNIHPTLQEFFPRDSWHKKAQSYLNQLEQEKQAEMVSGGSTTEDGVVW